MSSALAIGMRIHCADQWLGDSLIKLADEALKAHEEGKYEVTVNRAGVFLEGLFKRILAEWKTPFESQAMLGPLIGLLRKSNRTPDGLLERLGDGCAIRNRVSHDEPALLTATEGDSLQILNIVAIVVDWCVKEFAETPEPVDADLFPIFLSVGGPHRLDQHQFLQSLHGEMRRMGIQLRTLNQSLYAHDRPFDQIKSLLTPCRAALIVGLERSHAYAVFERELSDRQRVYQDQFVPTAWNQIEGSIASAMSLPILILRDHRLHQEGIFEAKNHRHQVRDFDLATESPGLSADLIEFLGGWVRDVRDRVVAV